MFNESDILARLQNGESVDAIANELTAIINKANSAYEDQKAKEAAEKAKLAEMKKIQEQVKLEELADIMEVFAEWLKDYYNVSDETLAHYTPEVILELIDSCYEYAQAVAELGKLVAQKPAQKVSINKPACNKKASADKVITSFLNEMGW
jgi:predicted house-cleaning noncanonical NTP pyrophosphatase (MazG superfamily)